MEGKGGGGEGGEACGLVEEGSGDWRGEEGASAVEK